MTPNVSSICGVQIKKTQPFGKSEYFKKSKNLNSEIMLTEQLTVEQQKDYGRF